MPRPLKVTLIASTALVLVVVTGVAAFLLSRFDMRSFFEALASEATGLDVTVNGASSVGIFPALHVRLRDVAMKNKESLVATLGEADIGVEFWPLLRKQVRINRLGLQDANFEFVRDRRGHYNFAAAPTSSTEERFVPAMSLASLSLTKVSFQYTNQDSGKEIRAVDCKVDSNDFQLAEGNSEDIMKHLSLSARIACGEMRNTLFAGTDVQISVSGEHGIFKLTPVTMRIMGGQGAGSIDANFTGAAPVYRVHYAATELHVDDLFKSLAPGKVGEGHLDFTTDLSMRGWDADELTRTADGEASLRGKDLDIAVGDLDAKLAHYDSSQNFNLVDVGAFFIVGPIGLVVTKGYNFASIFQGTGGSTHIRLLVSTWKVENGVARAQDVAMATKANRLALKGALDFVNRNYDDVTVAFLDDKGCARVEQKIRGPFGKPSIEKPNVIVSLAGPIRRLIAKSKKLFGAKCSVFYDGTVHP